ncbi:glutaredoxin [Photobacterium sanctipauli]|uniref:Glutaredoxin n=1 Tax=Photobacterium sanctipauli TaxID=1342794 RepID=A0A2T3NN79_9GAMM|nr:glutathione S-transferase N-terminal domain-containing protein [Photobacterium sanctipauli]PSW16939.1 glutaredoxin [Photobacterium sanctipauli]
MKLHVFDSCPFCVRVKAVIGLKGIECEISPMLLGELPASLEGKFERFTVPVLETVDPKSGNVSVMAESLDIIRKLDQLNVPMFDHYEVSEKLESRLAQLKPVTAQLLYPRMPKLNLPELSGASALNAFTESRKEVLGQSIEEALEKTEHYLPQLEEQLALMEQELDVEAFVLGRRNLNIDDIAAFAELRNFTMIAELTLSKYMRTYIDLISSRTNVATYPPIGK